MIEGQCVIVFFVPRFELEDIYYKSKLCFRNYTFKMHFLMD